MMKGGMMYKQKDIILIHFPYTDFTTSKIRPALIISNKSIENSEDVICCLITSNLTASGISLSQTDLESGKLHFDSIVRPHRIFTINRSIIKKRIGTINPKTHESILTHIQSIIS